MPDDYGPASPSPVLPSTHGSKLHTSMNCEMMERNARCMSTMDHHHIDGHSLRTEGYRTVMSRKNTAKGLSEQINTLISKAKSDVKGLESRMDENMRLLGELDDELGSLLTKRAELCGRLATDLADRNALAASVGIKAMQPMDTNIDDNDELDGMLHDIHSTVDAMQGMDPDDAEELAEIESELSRYSSLYAYTKGLMKDANGKAGELLARRARLLVDDGTVTDGDDAVANGDEGKTDSTADEKDKGTGEPNGTSDDKHADSESERGHAESDADDAGPDETGKAKPATKPRKRASRSGKKTASKKAVKPESSEDDDREIESASPVVDKTGGEHEGSKSDVEHSQSKTVDEAPATDDSVVDADAGATDGTDGTTVSNSGVEDGPAQNDDNATVDNASDDGVNIVEATPDGYSYDEMDFGL